MFPERRHPYSSAILIHLQHALSRYVYNRSLFNIFTQVPRGCVLAWQYTGRLQTYSKRMIWKPYTTVFIPIGGKQLILSRASFPPPPPPPQGCSQFMIYQKKKIKYGG